MRVKVNEFSSLSRSRLTIDHRSKQLDPVIKDVKQINRKRLMSESKNAE